MSRRDFLILKTFYVADGKCYRNKKMQKPRLTKADAIYLWKETTYRDKSWTFFSLWEEDFRVLHMPFSAWLTMNDTELFQLKENYANHIIDGMDVDSLAQLAYDMLMDSYRDCSEDEMIEEIKDLYDEDTLIDLLPAADWYKLGGRQWTIGLVAQGDPQSVRPCAYNDFSSNKPLHFTLMRKIEALMNTAIKNNTDWHMSNTRVDNNDGVSTVYLHNNKIAEVGDDFVRVFDGGWQSNTTKSRLNAIIKEFCNAYTDGIYQHKFEWFITDNKVIKQFVNGYTFAEFAW